MPILNMFKKGHKVMAFLPRRGGRKFLFAIKVNDVDEITQKVTEKLEEYKDDIEIKQYRYIIAVDTNENVEVKVTNPYFDEETVKEQSSQKVTKEDLQGLVQLELAETMLEAYKEFIPQLINVLFTSTADALKESFKKLVSKKEEGTSLKDIAQFVQSLVFLAQNKDSVKGLLKDVFSEYQQIQQKPEGKK